MAIMLTSPDITNHMKFLVKLSGAKKGIEVGTFTGYSALCVAQALPEDGKYITLDINEETVDMGRPYWKEAGVEHKIESIIGDGKQILEKMVADPANLNSFDFGYIDADKEKYGHYIKLLTELVKPGGFIMVDNTLW
mmetsp:Transcript_10581/g.7906  ORF Transcript_10581/g.7906 Transcript_10581/m.7906 type:complete len:137 (+) Transcript_10581:119-529(+)